MRRFPFLNPSYSLTETPNFTNLKLFKLKLSLVDLKIS